MNAMVFTNDPWLFESVDRIQLKESVLNLMLFTNDHWLFESIDRVQLENSINGDFIYTIDFLDVQFTNTTSYDGNQVLSYYWDFGDGNISTEQNPTHTYVNAGQYNVQLTISDGVVSDVTTQSIEVMEQITLSIDFSTIVNYLDVEFNSNTTYNGNEVLSYDWLFGDGNSSTEQNPNHTYATSGQYDVELTVTDGTISDVTTQLLDVMEQVTLTVDFDAIVNLLDVQFTSNPSYNGSEQLMYEWFFGDGNSSTDPNPSHTYQNDGMYLVNLIVTDGNVTDQHTIQITVGEVAQLLTSPEVVSVGDDIEIIFSQQVTASILRLANNKGSVRQHITKVWYTPESNVTTLESTIRRGVLDYGPCSFIVRLSDGTTYAAPVILEETFVERIKPRASSGVSTKVFS